MELSFAIKIINIILERLTFKNIVNIQTIDVNNLSLFQLFTILSHCKLNNIDINSLPISNELKIILSNTNAMINL